MATHSGKDGIVKVGANPVAEVRSFSLNETADTVEDTTMGDSARTHIVTLTSFDGSLDVYWDETDTNGQVALGIGSSVTLDLYPEGDGAGATYYTGTASVTSVNKSSSFDGMVEQSISVQGNGPLTTATV